MQTSQVFDATNIGMRPKNEGNILGGQCCAHLLNGSFYF